MNAAGVETETVCHASRIFGTLLLAHISIKGVGKVSTQHVA